jgi:hypothetical protein
MPPVPVDKEEARILLAGLQLAPKTLECDALLVYM